MPDLYQIPPPDCDSLDSKGAGGPGTLEPGIYSGIQLTGNTTMTLQPGLYCLDGDFTANNGTVTGNGVTLYFRSGVFSIGGNVDITLTAPTAKNPPAVKGLLIYLAKGNTGSIDLRGNATSFYQGTVYAPDGIANVGGTSSTLASLRSQILAKEVRFHGTTVMTLEYEEDENYSVDPTLNLLR